MGFIGRSAENGSSAALRSSCLPAAYLAVRLGIPSSRALHLTRFDDLRRRLSRLSNRCSGVRIRQARSADGACQSRRRSWAGAPVAPASEGSYFRASNQRSLLRRGRLFNRILVPTDGSESASAAAGYAIQLANAFDSTLVALHVVDVRLIEGPVLQTIGSMWGDIPLPVRQEGVTRTLRERGTVLLEALVGRRSGGRPPDRDRARDGHRLGGRRRPGPRGRPRRDGKARGVRGIRLSCGGGHRGSRRAEISAPVARVSAGKRRPHAPARSLRRVRSRDPGAGDRRRVRRDARLSAASGLRARGARRGPADAGRGLRLRPRARGRSDARCRRRAMRSPSGSWRRPAT